MHDYGKEEKKKEERKMTTGYLFSSLVSLPHSFLRQDFITVYVIKSMEKEKEDRTESVTHGIFLEEGGGPLGGGISSAGVFR